MKCPKCGKLIEDDSLYCTYCGATIRGNRKEGDVKPLRDIPDTFLKAKSQSQHRWPDDTPPERKVTPSYAKTLEENKMPFVVGIICIVMGLLRALFGWFYVEVPDFYDPDFFEKLGYWMCNTNVSVSLVLAALGVIIIMLGKKEE